MNWHILKIIFLALLIFPLITQSCKEGIKPYAKAEAQTLKGTEEVKQTYPTGETFRIYSRINGKKEGVMTEYYKSGIKRAIKLFENDLQHGKTVVYYESGKLKEVQYYNDDIRIGGDTIYHENGMLQAILTNDKIGQKDGDFIMFDSLGVKGYHAVFENGVLIQVNGKQVKKKK